MEEPNSKNGGRVVAITCGSLHTHICLFPFSLFATQRFQPLGGGGGCKVAIASRLGGGGCNVGTMARCGHIGGMVS